MVKDDQGPVQNTPLVRQLPVPSSLRRKLPTILVLAGIAVVAGCLMAHLLLATEEEAAAPEKAPPPPPATAAHPFAEWPKEKPALALVLSGQEHGYVQPCGCSRPQLGGLPRRYNFIEQLKKRGWPVVAVDLGDIPDVPQHRPPHEQALLKYRKSMEALQRMGYSAVGVGLYELEMPLMDALAEFSLQPNNTTPRLLAANLSNRKEDYFDGAGAWQIAGGNGMPRVGIVGVVGPSVTAKLKGVQSPPLTFGQNAKVLQEALQQLQPQHPEVLVLLYQGTVEEAKACAARFPQFHIILCQDKDEPSGQPERVLDKAGKAGDTLIISVGHKGRYVGVVGFHATNNPKRPFALRYQLVPLGEEYETPEAEQKTNPLTVMMEEYAQQVKAGNYLARYQQHKHDLQLTYPNATYVGSHECKHCHEQAYKKWFNSKHAEAYETLVDAKWPSLRQYDGECVACHVVGFGYTGGFTDEKTTAHLKNVGCESCHGPGSAHIDDIRQKTNKKVHLLMNPYRPKPGATKDEEARRINLLDQSCQKCHDTDNDVHWNFSKKWPAIEHHENRGKKAAPADGQDK